MHSGTGWTASSCNRRRVTPTFSECSRSRPRSARGSPRPDLSSWTTTSSSSRATRPPPPPPPPLPLPPLRRRPRAAGATATRGSRCRRLPTRTRRRQCKATGRTDRKRLNHFRWLSQISDDNTLYCSTILPQASTNSTTRGENMD